MTVMQALLISKDERFDIVQDMILEAAHDSDTSILLHPNWVKGIKTALIASGYTLTEWEGQSGDYYGQWVKISWGNKGKEFPVQEQIAQWFENSGLEGLDGAQVAQIIRKWKAE